jgi:hypothetical protein
MQSVVITRGGLHQKCHTCVASNAHKCLTTGLRVTAWVHFGCLVRYYNGTCTDECFRGSSGDPLSLASSRDIKESAKRVLADSYYTTGPYGNVSSQDLTNFTDQDLGETFPISNITIFRTNSVGVVGGAIGGIQVFYGQNPATLRGSNGPTFSACTSGTSAINRAEGRSFQDKALGFNYLYSLGFRCTNGFCHCYSQSGNSGNYWSHTAKAGDSLRWISGKLANGEVIAQLYLHWGSHNIKAKFLSGSPPSAETCAAAAAICADACTKPEDENECCHNYLHCLK